MTNILIFFGGIAVGIVFTFWWAGHVCEEEERKQEVTDEQSDSKG